MLMIFSLIVLFTGGIYLLQQSQSESVDELSSIHDEPSLSIKIKEMVNEISSFKKKIDHLELNLENAEIAVTKSFPNVKFKNYKDRKRILVI